MDYRSQVVLQKIVFFAGPEAGEHEDRLAYAGFADVDAFIGAGDAKPIGAGLLENPGDWRAAVTVTVTLDDREHHARRLALFVCRINEVADCTKVVRERGRGHFRPHGSPFDFRSVFLSWRHGRPEKKIVYDIRAAGAEAPRGCCV